MKSRSHNPGPSRPRRGGGKREGRPEKRGELPRVPPHKRSSKTTRATATRPAFDAKASRSAHQSPLELLRPASGICLGAVFSTCSFDEHFFESVLAALLPIHADPESDTRMFLSEARRRLRETPVIVLANRSGYAGGHRLPFHILLSPPTVALQARLCLLLFEGHARLIVGSADLMPRSFGESADFCSVLTLDYEKDAALLAAALEMLERAGASGEGWSHFVRQCHLVSGKETPAPPFPRLLASTAESSVLDSFLASIDKRAKVNQIHLLAPAQPEDDATVGNRALRGVRSFVETRGKGAVLNVAVAWTDSAVSAKPDCALKEPEQLTGYMSAELSGPPGGESVVWSPVTKVEKNKVHLEMRPLPLSRKGVATAMQTEPPTFWAIEEVTGAGMIEAIEPLAETTEMRWWAFPETQLFAGQTRRRPFRAKLVAICVTENNKPYTHLLVGCPNFDRSAAMVERVFEVGLHLRLEGHLAITDLCPELVAAPAEGFYLEDRSWLPPEAKERPPLEHATYDAKSHLLILDWQPRAPECHVFYQRDLGEQELLGERPGLRTTLSEFVLDHNATELRVVWGESQAFVPILVQNVSYLRADEPEEELRFRDLVALLASQRSSVVQSDRVMSAQEVFQAEHMLVTALASTGSLLGAFEVAMDGPLGLRVFADQLLLSEDCDTTEAWLYGLELIRLLHGIEWGKESFQADKRRIVLEFTRELEARLHNLAAKASWSGEVAKFYGGHT